MSRKPVIPWLGHGIQLEFNTLDPAVKPRDDEHFSAKELTLCSANSFYAIALKNNQGNR